MRVPISHALSLEEKRLSLEFSEINFSSLNLTFQKFPEDRKGIENIAREICNNGGSSGTIFNAANEVAVARFLADEVSFTGMTDVLEHALAAVAWQQKPDLEALIASDSEARAVAQEFKA